MKSGSVCPRDHEHRQIWAPATLCHSCQLLKRLQGLTPLSFSVKENIMHIKTFSWACLANQRSQAPLPSTRKGNNNNKGSARLLCPLLASACTASMCTNSRSDIHVHTELKIKSFPERLLSIILIMCKCVILQVGMCIRMQVPAEARGVASMC